MDRPDRMRTIDAMQPHDAVLESWNLLKPAIAAEQALPCCGSHRWAAALAGMRPFEDAAALLTASDSIWRQLANADWEEAFATHPRIGETAAPALASDRSALWSTEEQGSSAATSADLREKLRQGNEAYEKLFGRTYIVCATGKTAAEMYSILQQRLSNDADTEMREAAEQQRKITQLRLRKWLQA